MSRDVSLSGPTLRRIWLGSLVKERTQRTNAISTVRSADEGFASLLGLPVIAFGRRRVKRFGRLAPEPDYSRTGLAKCAFRLLRKDGECKVVSPTVPCSGD